MCRSHIQESPVSLAPFPKYPPGGLMVTVLGLMPFLSVSYVYF